MADCNIKYTLTSDFANNLSSMFKSIKPGPIIVVKVDYTVECVKDEGCASGTTDTCAWGPINRSLVLDVPLRDIFVNSNTEAAEECLKCIEGCADAWFKGICLAGCVDDECQKYQDENGGNLENVIDNDALDDIFHAAGRAAHVENFCGCPNKAPTKEKLWNLEKGITSYFDAACKKENA